jgi:uncharacterized protein HemY
MSAAEIEKTKSELIHWIEELSNVELLHTLETVKMSEEKKDWWDDLPESHRDQIEIGLKQAENGEGVSSEEFWRQLKNG